MLAIEVRAARCALRLTSCASLDDPAAARWAVCTCTATEVSPDARAAVRQLVCARGAAGRSHCAQGACRPLQRCVPGRQARLQVSFDPPVVDFGHVRTGALTERTVLVTHARRQRSLGLFGADWRPQLRNTSDFAMPFELVCAYSDSSARNRSGLVDLAVSPPRGTVAAGERPSRLPSSRRLTRDAKGVRSSCSARSDPTARERSA
jgi:hypothetical protein